MFWKPLLPFFEWCDATWVGSSIRASTWIFPAIETIHIFALTVLLGTIVVLDLRLLGLGLRRQPVALLAENLRGWTFTSLAVMLLSGVALFLSEAVKCFHNEGFRVKMTLLPVAILFHFTVFRRAAAGVSAPPWGKLAALVSLALWFGVGIAGRAIGFL